MIFPIFKAGASAGCSASSPSCSWTRSGFSDYYWSSTTTQLSLNYAFFVVFDAYGDVGYGYKTGSYAVRAVRAGL